MDYRFRISLVENGQKVFGEGPLMLLKKVEETGSLRQAALSMEMSYSKAWTMVKTMEKELKVSILNRCIGGQQGGGSSLTPEAKKLMDKYEQLKNRIDQRIREEIKAFEEGSFF